MNKKRTEGKIKGCLSIRDMYKYYKSNYTEPVDYKTFSKIIKTCNKELVRLVTEESQEILLPYRLGSLQIVRYDRKFTRASNKWAVDWKKTREHGFKIYHEQKYLYKWVWKKHSAIVKNKTGYKFTASRFAKREVPKAVNTKKVEYFKY